MRLTSDQVDVLLYALRDLIARRNLAHRPVPPRVKDLNIAALQWMSAGRHESVDGPEELTPDTLIGTAEAAAILGCTPRHAARLAADLDGQLVEGRWVFRRQTVVEYAELKGAWNDGNRVSRTRGGAVPPRAA
jgi:hypothetical protein